MMKIGQATMPVDSASLSGQEDAEKVQVEMLLLRLSNHNFLLPLEQVAEINRPMPLSRTPLSPEYFLGLANLRGRPLCVIDPGLRMGLPVASEPVAVSKQRFVSLRHPHMHVAIRVDRVEEIYTIQPGDVIQDAVGGGMPSKMADFIVGRAEIEGTAYDVLDWGALLC